jgi:hypothetical protein
MIRNIIFGVVVLLLTLYIIFYKIYPGPGNNEILKKVTPLNAKKDIMMSDVTQTTLLGGGSSSVMGFFYLKNGDRTLKFADGYTPLLQVENNWYLEISPSPIGQNNIAARLRVQTNDAGTLKYETIDLPQIPKQKWMFIAILREGRRFDIVYDNKIVASQRLESYPVVISSPLSVGNTGLDGSVIHVIVNSNRLSPSEVERERLAHVDTNGTVLEANSIDMNLPAFQLLAQCPPGLPCDTVTKPPSNNLKQWSTPYA